MVQKCHVFWSPVTVLQEKTFDEEFKTDEVQAWFRLQEPIVNVSYYPCLFTINFFNLCGAGRGGGALQKGPCVWYREDKERVISIVTHMLMQLQFFNIHHFIIVFLYVHTSLVLKYVLWASLDPWLDIFEPLTCCEI